MNRYPSSVLAATVEFLTTQIARDKALVVYANGIASGSDFSNAHRETYWQADAAHDRACLTLTNVCEGHGIAMNELLADVRASS